MIRLRISLGTLALWVTLLAPAQATDLLDLYQLALANDARFAAAQAQQRAGNERQAQGMAGLLPQISASSQVAWSDTRYEVTYGHLEQSQNNRSYTLQLVQPLLRWQNWIAYQQGNLQQVLADAQLEKEHQALILRLAQAYFAVLAAEDVVESVEQLRVASSAQHDSSRKRYDLGGANIIDVQEAQASLDSAVAQGIKARGDLQVAHHALERFIGREPGKLAVLGETLRLNTPVPEDSSTWVRAAKQGNLEVQVQEITARIADGEVRSRRSEHLPTLDLVLSHSMQQNPNVSTLRSDSNVIAMRLNLPLYSGGKLSAATREAVALADKAQYDLEDARRTAAHAAHQALSGVFDGIAQVAALRAAKRSAQAAVASNQLGYQLGERVGSDVLEALGKLSEAERKLAQARYDALMSQLKLKASVGALGYADLRNINAYLH